MAEGLSHKTMKQKNRVFGVDFLDLQIIEVTTVQ
jgi:hypothetical protein